MKTLAISILLLFTTTVFAVTEFTKVPKPSAEEEAAYLDLVKEIASTQKDIEAYFTDLQDSGKVKKSKTPGGETFTELETQAEVQTYYGQRDRYVYNELVHVEWDLKPGATAGTVSAKIKSVSIAQRRGRVGHGYVQKKKITASLFPAVKGEADALPINLVVNEILDSGKGPFVNFRFPETENPVDDDKAVPKVFYVRTHSEKMRMLREYWDTLRLAWRRIDWEVRSGKARAAMEMERVLRRQNDY